jgi:hypothetical protein
VAFIRAAECFHENSERNCGTWRGFRERKI